MTTKYVAKLDGRIVGKRTTQHRTYTHCVVRQHDVEAARKAAYQYVARDTDRDSFQYESAVAACEGVVFEPYKPWETDRVGQTKHDKERPFVLTHTAERIAEAKQTIEGGFDAYVARRRQEEIDSFERRLKQGYYEPRAYSWAGRLDLAQKVARSLQEQVWIVETEVA